MTKQELLEKTKELNQANIELEKRLEELNEAKRELEKVSDDFYKEIKDDKKKAESAIWENIDKLILNKKNELPPVTKTLVLKMEECERKKKGFGAYLLFFVIYAGVFTALVAFLDVSFTMIPVWRYVIAIIIDLVLSGVSLAIINSSKNKKIKKIKKDSGVSEYLKEIAIIEKQCIDKLHEVEKTEKEVVSKYNEQRDKDLKNIESEIKKIQAEREKIENTLFEYNNKNTIFLYAHNNYYDYEIFLNGLSYSEEAAHKLIKIKINEDLVNVRVISKHYSAEDVGKDYLDFTRDCGVVQVELSDTPVFLMLDGFDIDPLSRKEFFYRIENKKFKTE